MFDFGRKPSWIENPPEGTMVTTAEAPTDNPFLGFRKANMQAFTKFMEDRGYQTGAIRGLDTNREVWYDNETGTAYTLSDTSNATISGGKKLPPKKPATKAAPIKRVSPPRPSEPVRELDRDADLREQFIESQREFGAERIREALKQPTVDLAELEPRSRRVTPTRPPAPIRERRASEDPLTDAISADGDDAIDMAGLEPRRRTRQAPAPTLQSEQVAPSMKERKQRLIDAGVGGLLRETATGKSDDQLLEQLMMDQLEIGEKARDVPRDTSSPQDQVVSADRAMRGAPKQGIISPRLRSNIADISRRQQEEADRRVRIDNFEEQGPQAEGTDVLNVRTGRDRSRFGMPASVVNDMSQNTSLSQPVLNYLQNEADQAVAADNYEFQGPTMEQMKQGGLILEGERRREANPLQIRGAIQRGRKSSIDPQIQQPSMDRVEEGEIAPVGEGVEVGLLERLGNTGIARAIRDNPELAASGAQLLGGLISNAAQNRAQRRADRTTDQRVARANLISAITGGRARPTVERAQADTGGFMSLDTLGKALQGGGAAVKGELSRRVEEAERERKAGLEQGAADLDKRAAELAAKRLQLDETTQKNTKEYKDAIVDLNKKELDYKIKKLTQEQNEANAPEKLSPTEIKEIVARIQAVAKTDELTDFLETADLSFLEKGQFSLKRVPQFLFEGNQAEAEARRQNLIQAMAESYGGKLSNQDIERIDAQLFTQKDNLDTSLQVAQVFRSTLLEGLRGEISALEGEGYSVKTLNDMLNEVDQGQSESDADRLGSMLSDNPLDRISRQ